jgi:hypothetical protein
VPGDEAFASRPAVRDQIAELLVVDQRDWVFTAHHVCDLRSGEHRVQVQSAHSQLGAGHGRLDEAAMVAAHDRDRVLFGDAVRAQRARERVSAPVDFGEGERAALVDDRLPVGVPDR